MKPFWVTFYSYKGGVGRSLALANTAALLVKKGRRVLLIDFDLEAPGLDSFSEFSAASGKAGVVEYVSEFIRTQTAPDITSFVHSCDLPGPQRGALWVMPAGRKDRAYNHQLTRINWSELYQSGLGAPFFANWKAAINEEYKPDVVLVDSRTGLTEIGGVCTTQFPDLVVMLFGLNEQNIRGTATVAQSIRESDAERVVQIHFVASPVPNLPPEQRAQKGKRPLETRSQLADRLAAAHECLGTKTISTLHYYPPAALCEKLFVLDDEASRQPLISDYVGLEGEIIEFNRLGLDFILEQAEEALTENDEPKLERIVGVLDRDFSDRAEALHIKSRWALLSGRKNEAVELAAAAFDLDVTYEEPLSFLRSQYQRSNELGRLSSLYDRLLKSKSRFSLERLANIHQEHAEILMTLGKYSEAEKSYRICAAMEQTDSLPPALTLVMKFNVAESHRRASMNIDKAEWQEVVDIFTQSGAASDQPLNSQANQWQAMHIAYACIGDINAARDALKKARRAAESVGEIEEVFSVETYRNIAVSDFLLLNDKMLTALEQNTLWDGMALGDRN